MGSRRKLSRREEYVGIGLMVVYAGVVVVLLGALGWSDARVIAWKPLVAPPGVVLFLAWYFWRTRRTKGRHEPEVDGPSDPPTPSP